MPELMFVGGINKLGSARILENPGKTLAKTMSFSMAHLMIMAAREHWCGSRARKRMFFFTAHLAEKTSVKILP
jgi:hypothetical protein